MRAIAICCLVTFVAIASRGVARPADGPAVDPVWLPKVKAGLKSLLEKYGKLAPRLEEVSETRSDKAPGPARKMQFRPQTRRERSVRLDDNAILEMVRYYDGEKHPRSRLECDNADYHFDLGKSREDAGYALTGYGLGKRKLPLLEHRGFGIHGQVFGYLRAALGTIDNDGKHTLRALRYDDGKGLLRIDFSGFIGAKPFEERITVDPNRAWRLVERWVETPHLVGPDSYAYGTTVGGVEFPTGFESLITYKVDEAPPNMKITGKVTSIKLTDKTPADFRLSAFGFPEPMGAPPPPRPTRWYLWIAGAAGVCAALAFGFAYLRRRSQARLIPKAMPGAGP